jgi:hypothetical protein
MAHGHSKFGEELARDVVWLIAAALGVWWLWSKFGSQIQNAIAVRQNTKSSDAGAGAAPSVSLQINPIATPGAIVPTMTNGNESPVPAQQPGITYNLPPGYDPNLLRQPGTLIFRDGTAITNTGDKIVTEFVY